MKTSSSTLLVGHHYVKRSKANRLNLQRIALNMVSSQSNKAILDVYERKLEGVQDASGG